MGKDGEEEIRLHWNGLYHLIKFLRIAMYFSYVVQTKMQIEIAIVTIAIAK